MRRIAGAALARLTGLQPLTMFDRLVPKDRGGVRIAAGVPYGEGPRRRLDIYAPRGVSAGAGRPVILFFYGGWWAFGTRTDYGFLGRALAAQGFVTVVADYRLVPEGRFPGFVEDGAAALRWVRGHIGAYGGDGERIVVAGHSAGAYIAAMLAVDGRRLGPDRETLRGLIGLAGPYDFVPFTVQAARDAFGHWPEPAETQPVTHADAGTPPALLLTGADDVTVRPRNSKALAAKLRAEGVAAEVKLYPGIGHTGLILALARPFRRRAPVLADMAAFAEEVTR